jgi:predicted DNA-binding protein (UPF0251 family)
MLQDLITQANEHVVKVNRLCKELEEFEGILHVADMEDSIVALGHNGNMTTYIGAVLSPEKMEELKRSVVMSLTEARISKENELKKLMGIRKPAAVNPKFEAAIQDMVKSSEKDKPKEVKPAPPEELKPEMTESEVTRLYIKENKTLKELADYFGISKSAVNSYIYRHNLARKSKTKNDGFRDTEVEQRRRERP